MKYNKSEIMKLAHYFRRADKKIREKDRRTWSECLKTAWAYFKRKVIEAEKEAAYKAKLLANRTKFNGAAEFERVFFRAWENYGKRRIYMNGHKLDGSYIDLDKNGAIVAKNDNAREIAKRFLLAYEI